MTLIKSISGIRGTIGGKQGDSLTPLDIVKFTAGYAQLIQERNKELYEPISIVIGRDARISGEIVASLVASTLQSMGMAVIDLGLSTTPTVEMSVGFAKAHGGIIITASHNPAQWNALKLLNEKGEFLSAEDSQKVLEFAEKGDFTFVENKKLGGYFREDGERYIERHIEAILALPLVDVEAIRNRGFKVVLDCVNSTGGITLPRLLRALGVQFVNEMYCEPTGHFPHNPEPLPENLTDIAREMQKKSYDLGIVTDPDVDRLCFLCEDATMFGEEYTLVAIADYVLQHQKGATVSNLSSTQALRDVTHQAGQRYEASAVGEVNVVEKMKEINAVIGGEGNGGVIYPELHYGRDALVGVALFLTHLAKSGKTASMLRGSYPKYVISKNKISLTPEIDVDDILVKIEEKYKNQPTNNIDGIKIEFDKAWVHLRKSNTEPIIRIYAEAEAINIAENIANKIISDIKNLINP